MVTTENMTDGNASFLRAARSGNLEKVIEFLKGNIDINTSNANGLNALHLAAKEGHVNVVTELLKRGANVNAATKKGNTALHIASLAGQEEVVKVLIQLGANVNVQSQNGFTPLYMAAQENHDSVVSFLLANGANQSLATEDGFTPLAVALQQGHDKVVAVLLENDTKGRVRLPALHIAAKKDDCKAATLLLQSDHNPDVTSKSGFTPLHIAAHYGNENIAKILLSKGADVNYAAKHQITPLHVASKWGKTNMVTLLLEKGANIDAATRDGLTPLHCAARSGHDQVVDLLLEKGAPYLAKTKNGLAPLHMASQGDHVDSARILLYHKAPVDDVTVDYLTALHVAAHCGHVKVAKLLLDRKADPNARALNGFTPLHIACKKNRIKVVELLLKHGASIEATTESGLTPLHVASFMGCMNIVIYLIQNGANPDVPTVRGETPLHLAARANQTDIIRILLRNGASVDARAREEQTPLHIAARLGNVDIVSLLLQHGAAVDAVTKDMYTALHIAAKEDQEEVASALLDHGASLTSTTKKGFTPLHLAAKYGNIKVARLLIQKDAPVDAQGKNGVTPLHVAAHYDHINVALLLLDKGASPHAMAKNGYTPLHIAAKKNQMDIASTLLEYGANTNSESKAGFSPLHLAAQEGHADMSSLLIENKADVNHKANNGLTPLHLCAQDDRVNVASLLVKNGAEIGPQTKAGYTPLHVASHFGQINMVRFLLQNNANVHTTTTHGYTPLHQAAQQGHTLVVNLLLENQASPNVITTQGQTPLSIAQRLGYISVVETLKVVTETTVTTTTTIVTEEKYKVVAPETMQETFMTDSEDEGGEEAMLGDQSYRYLTADEMKSLGDDSLPIDVTKDEKQHDVMHSVKQFGAPMVEEDNLSPQHITPVESGFSEKFSPDNIDLTRAPVHAGFLVSFMVDARGGAMRGCRHSGVRVIIPPRKASMPMRITCRYLRKEKLIHPPPLMEGEACASRILEMGPVGARFLGPVIIEVPHFASTRGKEREITILRSDTGENWREHTLEASEEAVQEVLNESFEGEELSALEDLNTNRITRILTTDFPQYFAIISRVRQEVHGVGPEGGMVSSTVVPQVQAIFPEGALTKKIRVGLQAQPIAPELVAKLLGNRVAVSPIVTVEPRRRKFHKPITLTIPVPQAATKGMINQYSGDAPTLRLLCSITGSTKSGGSSKAQWEDVTGSTPLTFVNDCVSFTTTVSARFWLMDCRQVNEVTHFATELYQEAVYVPFMSKFVIFAKRHDPYEAQLRVFCMTDDKEDKTLESQEHFTEVAKSRDVEVLEGKMQYLEFAGNLVPVTKSGEQLRLTFQAFHENRLPFTIRVKDPHVEPMGRIAFMREPKAARGEPPQIPICNLNVALPEVTAIESTANVLELVTLEKRYDFIQEAGLSKPELIHRADLRLSDIARELDKDWILLAQQLDVPESDIERIRGETACEQSEQALIMLRLWLQKSGSKATGNELEKGLRKISREDIIKNCMFNVELVTDDVEKAVAKVHLDQSGFDVFKEELGSSREASMRRGASLDISYDEQDIMKEAESAAETSSETGSLFERDQLSQAFTDEKEDIHEADERSKIFDHENDVAGTGCTFKNSECKNECSESTASKNKTVTDTESSVLINNMNLKDFPIHLSDHNKLFAIAESSEGNKINKLEIDCPGSVCEYEKINSSHKEIIQPSQDSRKLHEFWPPVIISEKQLNSYPDEQLSKNLISSLCFEEKSGSSICHEKEIPEKHLIPTTEVALNNADISYRMDDGPHRIEALANILKNGSFEQEKVSAATNSFTKDSKLAKDCNTSLKSMSENSNEIVDLGYCSLDPSASGNLIADKTETLSLVLPHEKTACENKVYHENISNPIPINMLEITEFGEDTQISADVFEMPKNGSMIPVSNEAITQLSSKSLFDNKQEIYQESPVDLTLIAITTDNIQNEEKISVDLGVTNVIGDEKPDISINNCEQHRKENANATVNYSEDAKIRRASKTPPPSPVDEEVNKAVLLPEVKDVNMKRSAEMDFRIIEVTVGQEMPAKLTESETWPSGDLDTSQVSVSSLPDDEKSEPTTATVSSAAPTAVDADKISPIPEKTEIDESGSTTHIIQKTTHMTLSMHKKADDISSEDMKTGDIKPVIHPQERKFSDSHDVEGAEFKVKEADLHAVNQTGAEEDLVKTSLMIQQNLEHGLDVTSHSKSDYSQWEMVDKPLSQTELDLSTSDLEVVKEENMDKCVPERYSHEHVQNFHMERAFKETDLELEKDTQLLEGNVDIQYIKGTHYDQQIDEPENRLTPCAFVNTAFAGAEVIDEVEWAAPIRARSPYEVIRDDFAESVDLTFDKSTESEHPRDISSTYSKITYVTKHVEVKRRPILQHIPSEISEEDLVEREINSPSLKQEFGSFEITDTDGTVSPQQLPCDDNQPGIHFPDTSGSHEEQLPSSINDTALMKTVSSSETSHKVPQMMLDEVAVADTVRIERKEILTEISSSVSYHNGIDDHQEISDDSQRVSKEIEIKSDASEYLFSKTDEAVTPESDTGIATSPFELISESELSDGEHKSSTCPLSITLPKSDIEDKSQDSVIMTTLSQSFAEKTISASITTSLKDLSDTSKLNEKLTLDDLKFSPQSTIPPVLKPAAEAFVESDAFQKSDECPLINGPGEVEYQAEYDYDGEYEGESSQVKYTSSRASCSEKPLNEIFESEDTKKSRFSSDSGDIIESEIGEIMSSDQQLEDIIERPVTPEPPKDDVELFSRGEHSELSLSAGEDRDYVLSDDGNQIVLSPMLSPDDPKAGFAYGMQFEKDILEPPEEAMDVDSDPYSEEKEPVYSYGMRFERDPDLEEEEIPCYGDLYTHEEEDEDALENGEKMKIVAKPCKDPDFDILAGRKYFSKNVELDDLSMSSLQEFERLEAEIVSGRKSSIGSVDSFNGKQTISKSGEHDDVSMCSLTEFERIERECSEGEKIDPSMQESITQLSEIEEGHESQASEASQENKSDLGKEDVSILEDYDNQLDHIEDIILKPESEMTDELPFQYLMKQAQRVDKAYDSEYGTHEKSIQGDVIDETTKVVKPQSLKSVVLAESKLEKMVVLQKSLESNSVEDVKYDDIDQDSLHEEYSLKPDSLIDDQKLDYLDSLREEKYDDIDSLQGEFPDEMRDSLLEEKHIEDDSLHEMDILPDESSLSLENSLHIVTSQDSSKADDRVKAKIYTVGETGVTSGTSIGHVSESTSVSDKAEVIISDAAKVDIMLSSTDSLEPSSSAALAPFHIESESGMSSSLNSAITSEDFTMISSTDTFEQEGRITYRYEDIPVDDIEMFIRDGTIVDSEGNIQTQYNVKHLLETEDNMNTALSRHSEEVQEVKLPSSSTVHSTITTVRYVDGRKESGESVFHTTADEHTTDRTYESSHFDPDVQVEEIHTTDQYGNPKVIRKVKRIIKEKTQYSSSSSSKDVEEKLKEFLKDHATGVSAGIGEEEIQEEKTTDDKGNVVLIRTVQQQIVTEPQVHSRTFTGPDADTLSQKYVETFRNLDPTENICEFEKVDEQGNIVRVTQQTVVKPELHSVSFSGPNAHQQMEEYMKQWTVTSQSTDEFVVGKPHLFSADHSSRSSEQLQECISSESIVHEVTGDTALTKTILSSFPPQSTEQLVVRTSTSTCVTSSECETDKSCDPTDQTSSAAE